MGKQKAPPAPDYAGLAKQQAVDNLAANQQTAALARPTQIGPEGSQTWALREGADQKNPQAGDWIVTNKLSDVQQGLKDQQDALSGQFGQLAADSLKTVGDTMSQRFDISGLPQASALTTQGLQSFGTDGLGKGLQSFETDSLGRGLQKLQTEGLGQGLQGFTTLDNSGRGMSKVPENRAQLDTNGLRSFGNVDPTSEYSRQRITNALYQRQTAMLDPQAKQQNSDLTSRLASQGITEGSEAYKRATDNQAQQQASAYQEARNSAILAGGAEDSRIGAQNLNVANFQNQTRGQEFGERGQVAGFNNANLDTTFNQGMARQQQLFGQQSESAKLDNSVRAQQFGEQSDTAKYLSGVRAQQFGEQADIAKYLGDVRSQQFGEQSDIARFLSGVRGQQFSENQATTAANNTLHQNAVQEALMMRQLGMNEANALRTGNQLGTMNFQPYGGGGTVQAADSYGAAKDTYAAQVQAANMNNANAAGMFKGAMNLVDTAGKAYTTFSDRRVKTAIQQVGTHPLGIPWYTWIYTFGENIGQFWQGVMADELKVVCPEAVIRGDDGYDRVNYLLIGGLNGF